MLAANVAVPDQLAYDRAVLAFHQRIVLTAIGPALGELRQPVLQQLRHRVVDVLRAVVGVQAQDHKWKLMQDRFQHRKQKRFADLARTSYDLPLCDRIHRIDVIHPLVAIPVALMHRIDAQIARPPLRVRFAAFPDSYRGGPRGLVYGGLLAIQRAIPIATGVGRVGWYTAACLRYSGPLRRLYR